MQVILPKLGLTMTHGTLVEWLKQPGDSVQAEESLCTYETEKVTLELPAPAAGVLSEILVPAGTTIPAGTAVCVVLPVGEMPSPRGNREAASAPPAHLATPKARAEARRLGVDLATVTGRGPGGRIHAADVLAAPAAGEPIRATPLARRMAASQGVDLSRVRGTGPDGMITREDVAAATTAPTPQPVAPAGQELPAGQAVAASASPAGTLIPHSALRRTIAERMSQSAFSAPQVTLTTEAEATNLVSARAQLNAELPEAERISYNTLLAALVAVALREQPHLNATWAADGLHLLGEINIALAVDTERGLLTPVLHGVDRLGLRTIQAGYAALTGRALAGKSLSEDFADGTFTITNLGGLDVDAFTPIINPPQAAILGVGRIVEKPVARDGAVVIRPLLTLSLTFDHRAVDGAPAARFLQRVKQLVERPLALLLQK